MRSPRGACIVHPYTLFLLITGMDVSCCSQLLCQHMLCMQRRMLPLLHGPPSPLRGSPDQQPGQASAPLVVGCIVWLPIPADDLSLKGAPAEAMQQNQAEVCIGGLALLSRSILRRSGGRVGSVGESLRTEQR